MSHIPFAREADGTFLVDRLWADDLNGLVAANGPITLAAPQVAPSAIQSWGPDCSRLPADGPITFLGVPSRKGRLDLAHPWRVRRVLHGGAENADLVHTSNLYEPWTCLYAAHDHAVRKGKKTLFVVAEDFYDMFEWEWVRLATSYWRRRLRERTLRRLHVQIRQRVASASLTFLHTPAAVERYRLHATNAVAIRQPVHETADVIDLQSLEVRLASAALKKPLRVATASRFKPFKGLEFLIRAVAILEQRGIVVKVSMFGEGPLHDAHQALAARLGVAHRISFPGALAPASVLHARLSEFDIFVMPHLTNDFGRGYFDAITSGLPVIAFRSTASQDTVRDTIDGLLVPNADAEALASSIARVDDDRQFLSRASHAARSRALENTKSFWSEYRAGLIRDLFAAH